MKTRTPKQSFLSGHFFSRLWRPSQRPASKVWYAQIARELKVKRQARQAGRNNLPAVGDAEPDAVQQLIVGRFRTNFESLTQALWNQLKGALDLIVQRIPQALLPDSMVEETELAVTRIRDRTRNGLVALRLRERECHRDLQYFKGENELVRSASYPAHRYYAWLLLAGALLLETILNAFIFGQASPGYLRDGLIQAGSFSVVNIVLGFLLLGICASRYALHRNPWKRAAGIAGVILALVLGLGFNAYVAHYREVLEHTPIDQVDPLARTSYVDALSHLLAEPFGLTSWQAIVLFAIGLVIFGGLAAKGHMGFDDVYPGYGGRDRVHKKALRRFEGAFARIKAEGDRAIDATTARVRQRLAAEAKGVERARDIAAEAGQAQREIADSAADLARACTDNLRDYREANLFVRSDAPPAYFADYPSFEVALPEFPAIAQRLAEAEAAAEQNRQAANQLDRRLNRLAEAELNAFEAYLREIDSEVQRRLNETKAKGAPRLAPKAA
jgi:hypothetical protein